MRLIDANSIMRKMASMLNESGNPQLAEKAIALIDHEPTAFDKEKVISNLREELEFAEIEKERCIAENPSEFQSAKGYVNGVSFSLETVENGGVE